MKYSVFFARTFFTVGIGAAIILVASCIRSANAGGESITVQPWVSQAQEAVPGTADDDVVNAFKEGSIPAVSLQETPPWAENAEIVKCQVIRCMVDVPGWSVAFIIGGYNLGEDKLPSGENGHVLALVNVGDQKVSFGYAAHGGSYIILVPYEDGRPGELAKLLSSVAGYAAKIALYPDRNSPHAFEWNNQCTVHGCSSVRVATYVFAFAPDRPHNAFTRFITYARTDISK